MRRRGSRPRARSRADGTLRRHAAPSGSAHACDPLAYLIAATHSAASRCRCACSASRTRCINQRDLERVLSERAAELGADVRRDWEVLSFGQTEDQVDVVARRSDGCASPSSCATPAPCSWTSPAGTTSPPPRSPGTTSCAG
ncbi:FAD-dependent monooxygenase [Nonomuraea rosea]|uniref:FAD-dependent monooxygenase n=1 Tax=Nonomuraea rosea TaxID=638574 RepID=UPI003CD089ED